MPVADDGSAYFEVPGNTFVYFQALDANGKMVQSMRSGAYVQPGETYGCVGCHESRVGNVPPISRLPSAMSRKAQDNILRFADGFTLDATVDSNSRFAIGYTGTDWGDVSNCTKVVVDGGTVNVRGNSSNTCNFIGVDRSGTGILEIIRGTFHTDGYMRIAAGGNQKTVGIVRVEGGELQIANDLWMGTVYNGANAGQGTATFEMTGGQTTLRNFFAGATSSSIASSTVNLLGGVFEVAMFKCQACCRQAVTLGSVPPVSCWGRDRTADGRERNIFMTTAMTVWCAPTTPHASAAVR